MSQHLADATNYTPITRCLACDASTLQTYLDLGTQPLANSYHDGAASQEAYPLAAQVCPACFHSQLSVAVNPDLLYKHYLYVSGTTRTLADYFSWFVNLAETDAAQAGKPLAVLDIASNDGTLLAQFLARGHTVQGVDPAENLRVLSEKNGVPTHVGYWGADTPAQLGRQFDVIVAMNVLGHLPYPATFLAAVSEALAPGGLVYIQTSQADIFRNGEFDTMYHEHHSFFTLRSFRTLAERLGFKVVNVQKTPVHGNSYLWTLSRASEARTASANVAAMEAEEASVGYYDLDTYTQFGDKARDAAHKVAAAVARYRAQGITVGGYGAAAKGNTFMNFAQLKLDFIVDDNPLKYGLLTPGMDIPIVAPSSLADQTDRLVLVVLAWNFFDEIVKRVQAVRPGGHDTFIRYFPHFAETTPDEMD